MSSDVNERDMTNELEHVLEIFHAKFVFDGNEENDDSCGKVSIRLQKSLFGSDEKVPSVIENPNYIQSSAVQERKRGFVSKSLTPMGKLQSFLKDTTN